MNRAAGELHTVQSNVTARVRALEEELGVRLFQRHARGVTTTAAAQRMLPFVGRIAKLISDAAAAAKDDGTPNGALHLGSLETTVALRLSPILVEFTKACPQVRLMLVTGTTRKLVDDVVACRLEGAFVAGPVSHPALDQEVVLREELVLVTSRGLRSVKELDGVANLRTLVFQVGCSYRRRLDEVLAGMGIVTAEPMAFGSLDAIINCVSAGVGVTLLPRSVIARAWQDGRVAVHELPSGQSEVDMLFVRRSDGYVSSAMSAFLHLSRQELRGGEV